MKKNMLFHRNGLKSLPLSLFFLIVCNTQERAPDQMLKIGLSDPETRNGRSLAHECFPASKHYKKRFKV